MNIVSVENIYSKTKSCPSIDIKFEGKDVKLASFGVYSECHHYVITTDNAIFAVQPDTVDLLKLAIINDLIVWVKQKPEEDYYSVRILKKHSKYFFFIANRNI